MPHFLLKLAVCSWVFMLGAAPAVLCAAPGEEDFYKGFALEYDPAADEVDYEGAAAFYEAAYALGFKPAAARLAEMYSPHGPLTKGPTVWAGWLMVDAQAGGVASHRELGLLCLELPAHCPAGCDAVDLLRQAALGGDDRAALDLGRYLIASDKAQEGLPWLARAAEEQTPGAALALGKYYEAAQPRLAIKWLEFESGPEGRFRLGRILETQNHTMEALAAYEAAAAQNYPEADLALGRIHLEDRPGRRANPSEALKRFKVAAQAGLPEGAYQLGRMFQAGQSTPKDLIKAAYWFKKAADAGQTDAMNSYEIIVHDFTKGQKSRLARMLDTGEGIF